MLAASLVMAMTVGGFAAWLHYYELRGWPEESDSDLEEDYRRTRRRRRTRIHILLGICSVLIAVAGIAGRGRVWIGCWMIVALVLVTIVQLALLDAIRTHRYFRSKLPRIPRELIDGE